LIQEQTAVWPAFPCCSQFGLVNLSQLVQLWLSFAQELVRRIGSSRLALLPHNGYPDLR
jgi:hypothetical protein